MTDRFAPLARRYTRLGWGELAAATVFTGIALTRTLPVTRSDRGFWALAFALAPLIVVLVQGGVYWLLARQWVGRGRMPPRVAAAYRLFRIVDPVLLGLGFVGMVVCMPRSAGSVVIVAVWLFGVVEYLNYFVVRLAYPWHRWAREVVQWRTPRLVQDMFKST